MSLRYVLLGRDVSRSLSPRLHRAAAASLGIPLLYEAYSCPSERELDAALDDLRRGLFAGANVTIPYKERVWAAIPDRDAAATAIGAANCVVRGPRLLAYNTDGPALVHLWSRLPPGVLDRVVVLGAGGAARAACWALQSLGVAGARIAARSLDRAVAASGSTGVAPVLLGPILGCTLVVSTLPPDPALAEQALGAWIPVAERPQIYDLAYDREGPSVLAARAHGLGLKATDGRAMLIEQAARSFSLWTEAPLEAVREAMTTSLPL